MPGGVAFEVLSGLVDELVESLTQAAAFGQLRLGDVISNSRGAHRFAEHRALLLGTAGANLVFDQRPQERGRDRTHGGALCRNRNLYYTSSPEGPFQLIPLARDASTGAVSARAEARAEKAASCPRRARPALGRRSSGIADPSSRALLRRS